MVVFVNDEFHVRPRRPGGRNAMFFCAFRGGGRGGLGFLWPIQNPFSKPNLNAAGNASRLH